MTRFGLFFFLVLFPMLLLSQKDSTSVIIDNQEIEIIEISESDLESFRSDDAYKYEIETSDNSWWEGLKNWFYSLLRRFFEWLFGVDAAPTYISFFLKYIPYLLLGVLLFLIIRFFLKANTRNILFAKNNKASVILSEEERIIKTEDIQALIKQALEAKQFRLAIRYYYLFILKLLSEKELITWELQKTNDDYIKELSNSKLQPLFSKVTLLYDYIWYGEFAIDQESYNQASVNFDQLKNFISTNV